MRSRLPLVLVPCLSLAAAAAASAQTSFPMITHATPVAVQRGTTAEVIVHGRMSFEGTYRAIFEGPGIRAEVVKPMAAPKKTKGQPAGSVKLRLHVAPDAPLGVREFRLASTLGISSIGQLVIVDDPVVEETSVNNTAAQAQAVKLPTVIAGRLEAKEDVDYFKFEAKAGEHLTFELLCARLQDKIHDLQVHAKPMLVLYDAEGRELAANDHFYFADPLLSYQVTQSGTYYLQVRESTYDGDARWVYALLATNRPYATHLYPMAGNPGKAVTVEPIGSAGQVQPKVTLTAPPVPGVHQIQLAVGGARTNPVTFVCSDLPQFVEAEPNDAPAQATRVTLPCGINGRIGQRRDLDHFVFRATKGRAIRFEVKARRFGTLLQSSIHAVLDVMTADGKVLSSNSDTHLTKEASLVFRPAADGDYVLRVRDLNSKGGETFVYFVEADWAQEDFTLKCDPDKAMIGPGTSTAWFVQVERQNGFAGPVKVEVRGLPAGVRCSPLTIPPSMTQGVIVLTADAGAAHAAANVAVVGTATLKDADGKPHAAERLATARQEIYLPGGGRGLFDVNLQTVAVTDPSDVVKVKVSTNKVILKPGQEVKIDVEVERHPRYDKGITLDLLLRHLGQVHGNPLPPGVTLEAGKSKTLLGKGSKGHLVLRAAAGAAPVEDVPLAVLANVSVNFVVKIHYTSEPILLSVRP